jgi:hypothetical protein
MVMAHTPGLPTLRPGSVVVARAHPDRMESECALDSLSLRTFYSENRLPPRIKSGAAPFRDTRYGVQHHRYPLGSIVQDLPVRGFTTVAPVEGAGM